MEYNPKVDWSEERRQENARKLAVEKARTAPTALTQELSGMKLIERMNLDEQGQPKLY